MIDEREVREMLLRRAHTVPATVVDAPTAVRRGRRRLLVNGVVTTVAAAAITVATFAGIEAIPSAPIPAVPPEEPSLDLGIFAPVSGRIIYENGGYRDDRGADRGYGPGIWAVDPSGPSDTVEGPSVADDVAATLARLDLVEDALPPGWSKDATALELLGWSSDGTELLFMLWRGGGAEVSPYVLHADGSVTRLNEDPMMNASAAISPDGSRVVFVGGGAPGLNIVDAEGGQSVRLPYPADGEPVRAPTFSPDGTQIAYLAVDGVWVVNADGSDAHEILANEATREWYRWFSGMQWSPAGDRIAIGLDRDPAIYTFAPDGSDFTKVIVGGSSPYWSPDGSQIAYTIQCDEDPTFTCVQFDPQAGLTPPGLAIADADGSNVRAFGFAASGPWHPGASMPVIEPLIRG